MELYYVKKKKESNFVLELVVQIGKNKKKDKLMWIQKFMEDLRETTLRSEFCAWK